MIQRMAILKSNSRYLSRPFQHMALFMVVVVVVTLGGAIRGHATDRAFDEYQVKSVFLYRLTLFITWPGEVFSKPDQPFVIGILGDDPFGKHIDRVVKDEGYNNRPIRIRRYPAIEDIKEAPCQVLFINRALKPEWPELKKRIGPYPILTVSDMEAFGQMGGMINIKTQINKIKIEINPDETRMAGLKISSKLLKVSRNVATVSKGGSQ